MSFDVEAARRVVREAEAGADDVAPGAAWPVIDALTAALDEITRLTNTLPAVHMALGCTAVRRTELAAPVEKRDAMGRVKPDWCER